MAVTLNLERHHTMSKEETQAIPSPEPHAKKRRRTDLASILIPIIVGVVVVAIIVGGHHLDREPAARRSHLGAGDAPPSRRPPGSIPYPGVPRISLEDTQRTDGLRVKRSW